MEPLKIIDLHQLSEAAKDKYTNAPLNQVNDHITRLSVMTQPYYWHYHPNSDETFLVLEGMLIIDLEDQTMELSPGQLFTVTSNVLHRTKPKGSRSVNLSFELAAMQTIKKNQNQKHPKTFPKTSYSP